MFTIVSGQTAFGEEQTLWWGEGRWEGALPVAGWDFQPEGGTTDHLRCCCSDRQHWQVLGGPGERPQSTS